MRNNVYLPFIFLVCFCPVVICGCQDYGFEEQPDTIIDPISVEIEIKVSAKADILFVIDNSGSMAGEQLQIGESFEKFVSILGDKFGDDYHIAVITTGVLSEGNNYNGQCPPCTQVPGSCINETGESGVFQDMVGRNIGTEQDPDYDFEKKPECRIVTSENIECFYDPATESGTVMAGVIGCGYERGLEAIRKSLDTNLLNGANQGFLRDDATLAIIVISDEDDCGAVGDINEGLTPPSDEDERAFGADVCYYAIQGEDPLGNTSDLLGKPYALKPVQDYYNFLVSKKGQSNIKFAAVLGATDESNPSSCEADFYFDQTRQLYRPAIACTTPGCTGEHCAAKCGTRYIELAKKFVIGPNGNGFIGKICKDDFSDTMEKLATFIGCPEKYKLNQEISDSALANFVIDGKVMPIYSCTEPVNQLVPCDPNDQNSCSAGVCTKSWIHCKDNTATATECDDITQDEYNSADGGYIVFAGHYDPCKLIEQGVITIKLVYIPK